MCQGSFCPLTEVAAVLNAGATGSRRAPGWHHRAVPLTLDHLRRYAVARTLFPPTTLMRAIEQLGFVQADPIRAPARAQDLTLRHRVAGYRAGDLERRYPRLALEEDFFVNYGFLPRAHHALMHPRTRAHGVDARRAGSRRRRCCEFVARARRRASARGRCALRARQDHQLVRRLVQRDHAAARRHALPRPAARRAARRRHARLRGARARPRRWTPAAVDARIDALVDLIVRKYAPLPRASLRQLVITCSASGAPQWNDARAPALAARASSVSRTRASTASTGTGPPTRTRPPGAGSPTHAVRLLTPFDPIVWDRRRFELFWGWTYRFEAYTPAPKRKLGYYALPLLWRDRVIGWANLAVDDGTLRTRSATSTAARRAMRRSATGLRPNSRGCVLFSDSGTDRLDASARCAHPLSDRFEVPNLPGEMQATSPCGARRVGRCSERSARRRIPTRRRWHTPAGSCQ